MNKLHNTSGTSHIGIHWESIQRHTPSLVTMGNFDGVHKGHVALLHTLKQRAQELGVEPLVVTFLPHPKVFFDVETNSFPLLSSPEEKKELIEKQGVQVLFVEFESSFANLSPEDFVQDFLQKRLLAKGCLQGPNHRFGKEAKGDHRLLEHFFGKQGTSSVVPLVQSEGESESMPISSSFIRDCLFEGKVELAAELLGRIYSYSGKVVHGDGRGRGLGFPTANLEVDFADKLLVLPGVYGTEVVLNGEKHAALVNIGRRPTFFSTDSGSKTQKIKIEVHILHFNQDIYGQNLVVKLNCFLREEKKFQSGEELVSQIQRDMELFGKSSKKGTQRWQQ